MGKLRTREVKEHTACKWQNEDWTQLFCSSNLRTQTLKYPWIKLPLMFRNTKETWVSAKSYLQETLKDSYKAHRDLRGALGYSRRKRWVVLCTSVIGVQIEHPNHEGHKDHDENDHELEDIFHSSPQWDLQGPKTFVGWQDVRDSREAQHDSYCIQPFWYDLRVWGPPLVPG